MVKWDAEDYSRNSKAQQTWARELVAKLHLEGDESVLDIGCGDGKVTREIAGLLPGGNVVGIDSSREMIEYAEGQRCVSGNASFRVCDARELQFVEEFDVVFSNATLHWVIDHRPVLAGIGRALKPGGRLLLQMGGRGNAEDVQMTIEALIVDSAWSRYFTDPFTAYGFYGPEEYIPWLRDAGLMPLRVELLERGMVQPGGEGLAAWIRTTWLPYTQRVPEAERGKFVSDVVERYIESHPADDEGMVLVRMVRLEVEALRPKPVN